MLARTAVRGVIGIVVVAIGLGTSARGATPKHVYIAAVGGIYRYPLVNGLPGTKPDLEYPGLNIPMAVDARGTLYATLYAGPSNVEPIVEAFPLGSTHPSGIIPLPYAYNFCGTDAWAIAVDSNGYVFASYSEVVSCAWYDRRELRSPNRPLENGIAVYRPFGPNGIILPLETYHLRHDGVLGARGLAFSPAGELFATIDRYGCNAQSLDVVDDARGSPRLVRTIKGPPLCSPTSISFDLGTTNFSVLASSQVLTYANDARGRAKPLRSFYLPNGSLGFDGIANSGPYIFATRSATNEVLGFRTEAQGHPRPVSTLSISTPADVKVGL